MRRHIVIAPLLVAVAAAVGAPPGAGAEEGLLSTPISIGDGSMTLTFGGFAKVDFIQDFNPVGNPDQFKVNSIPVEGTDAAEQGASNNISARQTRFTLDLRSVEDGGLRVYVEGDFFGEGNAFRLRHGYGEWQGLLGGQTWTTFQDISARPHTLDYEGPDSEIFVRQPMLRFTHAAGEHLEWSVALEDPQSQLTLGGTVTGTGRAMLPDIPARVIYRPAWGHVQLAALLRQIRFVSDDGSVDENVPGYGANLSAKAKVFGDDAIMGHVAAGSGMGRYIESFGGTGSDAVLNADDELDPIGAVAATFGYEHQWNEKFRSTLAASMASLDVLEDQPDDAIESVRALHANLVYHATKLVSLGGELMWGERENKDGATGSATRFQFSVQYKFR